MQQYATVVYKLDTDNPAHKEKMKQIKEDFVSDLATALSAGDLATKLDRIQEIVDGEIFKSSGMDRIYSILNETE